MLVQLSALGESDAFCASRWNRRAWKFAKNTRQTQNSLYTHLARQGIMTTLTSQSSIKVVGANGQISLGKQFAGREEHPFVCC
jgi:hypothetical protein